MPKLVPSYLELQSASNILLQCLRYGLIKVTQDFHRQLRVDARVADKVIESVCQSQADAAICQSKGRRSEATPAHYLLFRYSS